MFFNEKAGAHLEPGAPASPKDTVANAKPLQGAGSIRTPIGQGDVSFPPGLLGGFAEWALSCSPRPIPQFSLASALAMTCSLSQRCYNVSGQGLNQYIIVVGHTGTGKDIVQSFPERFYAALRPTVKAIDNFRGPGELVSSAGLIKSIDRNIPKSLLNALGELGITLKEMAKPNASPNMIGVQRLLLQLYSKSGRDQALGESAYSDREKNTGVIHRPALTIIGETTPGTFYSAIDDMMANGLAPRFMVFEYLGHQVPLAHNFAGYAPDPRLVSLAGDFAAHCLSLNDTGGIVDVGATPSAQAILAAFEEYARRELNGASNETAKHIWNRAHLKALKLAAVCAVGINYLAPEIDCQCAQWATDLIAAQALNLLSKFETGDTGRVAGNQTKQEREIKRVVADYCLKPWSVCSKYHGTEAMHGMNIITQAHIAQRLYGTAAFREDRQGAKPAIERGIKSLCDADILREIPRAEMVKQFGKHPRAFAVSDPEAILKEAAQ